MRNGRAARLALVVLVITLPLIFVVKTLEKRLRSGLVDIGA